MDPKPNHKLSYIDINCTRCIGQLFYADIVIVERELRLEAEQLSCLEECERASSLWIECCCGEKALTEELLDSVPMFAGLSAPTEREIEEVNSIGMNDSKCPSTALGVRARISGVMTELEDVTRLSEG